MSNNTYTTKENMVKSTNIEYVSLPIPYQWEREKERNTTHDQILMFCLVLTAASTQTKHEGCLLSHYDITVTD